MMKIQKAFYPIVNNVIRILLLIIAAGMCLQSMFSTSFVGVITKEDGSLQERTLNIADQPWKHLLVFAAFTVMGVLLYRRIPWLCTRLQRALRKQETMVVKPGQDKSREDREAAEGRRTGSGRLFAIGTIVILIMGTVWVFATRLQPGSDPAKVYQIAMQWRRGDFSAYAEGGYLFRYPFQAGIILFYYLLSFVFGLDNYIGLQFANVIALAVVYGLLVKLSAVFWQEDEKLPSIVYAALILWVPLSFYVTYLYGILPGMALSLGAVYFAAKYLTTRRYRYILPAALCMGLATVVKMNCLIYLAAIGCFLLYDAIDIALLTKKEAGRQWIASLVCLALMGLGVVGCNRMCSRYVEHLSGYKAGDGEVMVSWIVMGLQETPLGPGGYSGYINEVFERYEYDAEKITEASIADIKKIVTRLSENPLDEGIPFFARKNAFQWNDPTFICLDRTKGRETAGSMPAYARSLIEGKGSVALSILLNYAQTLLLAGFILYLVMNRRSRNIYELMGAVVFLGGYMFHFFWESSASYTIPYFVILIPYAVKGLADWVRWVSALSVTCKRKVWAPVCALLAMVCLLALFSRTDLFDRTIALNDGEDAARQFYDRGETGAAAGGIAAGLSEGYYYLSPCLAQDAALTVRDGKMTFVSVSSGASENGQLTAREEESAGADSASDKTEEQCAVTKVSAVRDIGNKILALKKSGGVCMRFRSNEQTLAIDCGGDNARVVTYLDDDMNTHYVPAEAVSYQWTIRPAKEGGYYITIDDLALTYRNGEVVAEALEEGEEQRWVLQP